MEKKKKAYIICSRTLKELQDHVRNMDMYSNTTVYEYKVDRSDISEEQKEIQMSNQWYRERTQEFRISDTQIYDVAKKLAVKKILDGCKKDIAKSIFEELYNTNINIVAWIDERSDHDDLSTMSEFGTKDEWGNDNSNRYEYSNDIDEFKEKLNGVKYKNSFSAQDNGYVLLEKISLIARPYRFDGIDDKIKRLINRAIKEELTYCLKKDEVVIPQEYIDKGVEGIKEWREIKASKNKNNSIEKKILREAVNEKKAYAYNVMCKIMDAVTSADNINWAVPFITIDGRWNKQRTSRLVNNVVDNKNPQYYIDTSKEEFVKMFKEYWKKILKNAYENVEKLTIEEEEKI